MKFGISLSGLGARHYPEVAAVAEQAGFDSLWMPEHLVFPVEMPPNYGYTEDGYPPMNSQVPSFDPFVVLGAVSSRTSTIRLGTGVFILPLRHPIQVARSTVTLDRMSGGRLVFGIGVGWMPDEFSIVGEDFANRGKRTDEIIDLLRRCWRDDVIEHHGDHYDIPPVYVEPKPVRGPQGIPIIVGGTSKGALERAGRLGDGWIHHAQIRSGPDPGELLRLGFADLEAHITTIEEHRRAAGRTDSFEYVAGLGSDLDVVKRCEQLGVTTCQVGPKIPGLRGTKDQFADWIVQFGADVIERLR